MKQGLTYLWMVSLLMVGAGVMPASAQTVFRDQQSVGPSGLTIPRFVSLSASEANLRTGPGERYPILWVFVRRGTPLEVTAEYGAWRRVRDIDGTIGWMHSALLSGTRTAVVSGSLRTFYAQPNISSEQVLRAEPGVMATIESCLQGWCQMEVRGINGWLPQEHFWGTYFNEEFE